LSDMGKGYLFIYSFLIFIKLTSGFHSS
jgi:hypothetical protein